MLLGASNGVSGLRLPATEAETGWNAARLSCDCHWSSLIAFGEASSSHRCTKNTTSHSAEAAAGPTSGKPPHRQPSRYGFATGPAGAWPAAAAGVGPDVEAGVLKLT